MDTIISKRRRKAQPTLGPYNEGGYKWAVYCAGDDGKRRRRKFIQRVDASAFLADKLVEAENLGTRIAASLDDDIKRETFAALELLKRHGVSLLDAAKQHCAHLEATTRSALITDLIDEFTESKVADGKAARYAADLKGRMRLFVEKFGTRYAAELTTKDIQEWLAGLMVGPLSRNHFRRVVGTFFSWCWRLGYCSENPVLRVSKVKVPPGQILVYTPKEMAKLLRSAATWNPGRVKPEGKRGRNSLPDFDHVTTDILANIVLCGFAGLRQSEFERLTWEQVKIDRGVIDLSATITKTAARRLVKIRPVLLEWLRHLGPFRSGPIIQTNYSNRMTAFRRQLKMPWKHNALRHSFASYLMEDLQNPGEVSLQLGHSNVSVVFAHYRALVAPEDNKGFWDLTPAKVLKENADLMPFQSHELAP
jgi:integrase